MVAIYVFLVATADIFRSGLCYPIRQTDFDRLEIRPSSLRQLQEAVYHRMVYHSAAARLQRRILEHDSAAY